MEIIEFKTMIFKNSYGNASIRGKNVEPFLNPLIGKYVKVTIEIITPLTEQEHKEKEGHDN